LVLGLVLVPDWCPIIVLGFGARLVPYNSAWFWCPIIVLGFGARLVPSIEYPIF